MEPLIRSERDSRNAIKRLQGCPILTGIVLSSQILTAVPQGAMAKFCTTSSWALVGYGLPVNYPQEVAERQFLEKATLPGSN